MIVGLTAVLATAVREVVQHRRAGADASRRRLGLRLATAATLMALLGAIWIGVARFGINEPAGALAYFLAFWGCIAMLIGAVFCLVIADLRMVADESHADAGRLLRDIVTTIAEHQKGS